jgi:SAM-dependent methyltransferase
MMGSGAHDRLFDLVAAPYDLFYHSQRRAFRHVLRAHGDRLGLTAGARILDIGCGTGALASVLAERGYRVHAVEPSAGMRARARRHFAGTAIVLRNTNPLRGLPYVDGSFDLVYASHVVHGLRPADRVTFHREALRVSKGLVLLHDYPPRPPRRRSPDVHVLEALERSDYHRFVRTGLREMRGVFASVEVIPVGPDSVWYVCRGSTRSSMV